jgi:phosphoserine phosphatase RsbU/P
MGVLLRRANRVTSQPAVWLGLALVLDAVIAVGIVIGHGFQLTELLAAGPLLACARCNGRMTGLAVGYAIALCAIVAPFGGPTRATLEAYRVGTVLLAGVLAVLVAVIRTRRESALIRISERVQRAILRPLPAELGGVAFASHYQSATTQALVGGDLYDITMTQFGPRFIIGDVKGKGLDAVGRCAAVLAAFRELAFAEADLVKLAEQMDARLSYDMEIEDFVTVIVAEFAPGVVRIANCGHHPPVKLAAETAGLQIMAPLAFSPPLGLHPHPARQDIALNPGDRLLFYTDGLVETRDRAGRFFALDARVAAALAAPDLTRPDLTRPDLTRPDLTRPDLDGAVRRVVRLLLEHAADGLTDDVLLVLCEPVTSAAGPLCDLAAARDLCRLAQPVKQQIVQPVRRVYRHPVTNFRDFLVTPWRLHESRRILHPLAVQVMVAG